MRRPRKRSHPQQEAYGGLPRQVGQWWLPPEPAGPGPAVVLVHGGFWRARYDLTLQDPVAADLAGRGLLVWNVDYRASDAPWPATLDDAAAAYDALGHGRYASLVDPARIAVVGHSAGGHLALWLASRRPGHARPAGVPAPRLVVAQAPVAALVEGAVTGLGRGAVDAFVGGSPHALPERYDVADPALPLPTGVRTVLVHGEDDDVVPISQSETYVQRARAAGDDSTLVRVPGGHFPHLEPGSAAVQALVAALEGL